MTFDAEKDEYWAEVLSEARLSIERPEPLWVRAKAFHFAANAAHYARQVSQGEVQYPVIARTKQDEAFIREYDDGRKVRDGD